MATKVRVCATGDIEPEELIRFDQGAQTFCVYRSPEDEYFATEGTCSHERVHLSEGLVMDHTIECPKHGGVFDYRTGEALSRPTVH